MSQEVTNPEINQTGSKAPESLGAIKTMPDYFRKGKHLKYRSPDDTVEQPTVEVKPDQSIKKNNKVFVMIIAILIIVITGIIGYVVWQQKSGNQGDAGLQAKIEQERLEQERLRLEEEERQRQIAEEEQRVQEEADQKQRDEQRVLDIAQIQTALEKYFEATESYPSNLISGDSLNHDGEIFLESIPLDPNPSKSTYNYTVAPTDALSYTLSFSLEIGFETLTQGLITVSSERQLQEDGSIKEVESKRQETGEQLLLPSLDSDQDGLTDIEETLLYTTDKDEFDSDFDTYSDKQELLNLYNPFGDAPITLIDSGNVLEYANALHNYRIYYPQNWVFKSTDGTDTEVLFTSTTGEFIEVLILENPEKMALNDWYVKQYGEDNYKISQVATTNQNKLTGVRSFDRKKVFFAYEDKIYVIIHNTGNKTLIDYGVTFEMMVKSFRLEEVDKTTEPRPVEKTDEEKDSSEAKEPTQEENENSTDPETPLEDASS